MVGDRDGYRAAPCGNWQELRGEIKAAPVFRRSIVEAWDSVPGNVLFIRNSHRITVVQLVWSRVTVSTGLK